MIRLSLVTWLALCGVVVAAAPSNLAGEYTDRKFLGGQAVFQMSLEQSGNSVSVWFYTAYNDGHGCGPEATGSGKVTGTGSIEFNFHDSSNNSGTGTITPAADGVSVSLKLTHVSDQRCLQLYRQTIRLKKLGKK